MQKLISAFFIILFFGFIVAGLHYGIYFVLVKQGALSLKEIYVSGNKYLKTEAIIESCGVSKGTGIFDFSLQDLSVNIGTNRMVDFAEVKRYPPDSIEIKITERQPVCAISVFNNYYMCDKNGNIILSGYLSGFPVIIPDFEMTLDDYKVKDEYIRLIMDKLSNPADIGRISKIYIKKLEGIYITVRNLEGTLFFIGKNITDSEIFNKIFGVADKILSDNIKIKFIDINKENAIGFRN